MKRYILTSASLLLLIFGCNYGESKSSVETNSTSVVGNQDDDKKQIENLVRQVYQWHDTDNSKNEIEPIADGKRRNYIAIDIDKHTKRIQELRDASLFSDEFIENYDKIAQTINLQLKSGEMKWDVGDLPPFGNNANPWCNCQDYPYDKPWDKIVFTFQSLDSKTSTLTWTWGDSAFSKGFNYKVSAVKVNGNWKLSYLQGFDFSNYF